MFRSGTKADHPQPSFGRAPGDIDTVVCLHGYGWVSVGTYFLKKRLESVFGWRVLNFGYRSMVGSIDQNAAALANFIESHAPDGAHLIGHSLGGVVALRMLAQERHFVPGRVVCLGSPLAGSRAAEAISRIEIAKPLTASLRPGIVDAPAAEWASGVSARRDVGIIAGTGGLGFGRFLGRIREPNDGTIAVSETRLEGADHLILPVSHNVMLASPRVIDHAASFLLNGEF